MEKQTRKLAKRIRKILKKKADENRALLKLIKAMTYANHQRSDTR